MAEPDDVATPCVEKKVSGALTCGDARHGRSERVWNGVAPLDSGAGMRLTKRRYAPRRVRSWAFRVSHEPIRKGTHVEALGV